MPYRNPSDEIDREPKVPASDDGVYVDELADGAVLELDTKYHHYRIVKTPTDIRISGHPKFCPEPVTVEIDGSTGRGFPLKPGYIGRGMHLIFEHPVYHTVTTSRILDIHRLA